MNAASVLRRFALVALTLVALVSVARADGFGPLIAPREFSGDIRLNAVVGTKPYSFTFNTKRPLDKMSADMVALINKEIPKYNLNFRGFRPYDVRLVRSAKPVLKGLVLKTDISLEYVLKGNTVSATFTTPDIVDADIPLFGRIHFGLDRAADPRMTLTFDLTVRATLSPQLHGAPRIKTVTAHVSNAKLRPANFPAEVVTAGNDLVRWVSGKDFRGMAEAKINGLGKKVANPLQTELSRYNSQIAAMTKQAQSMDVMMMGNRIEITYSTRKADPLIVR